MLRIRVPDTMCVLGESYVSTTSHFCKSCVLSLIATAAAFAIPGPTIRQGNLSVGKFYTFSMTPNSAYPDSYPNEWTAGAELTDETAGGSTYSNYVGWIGYGQYSFEITFDLGKQYTMRQARVNCASRTDWGIFYPESVTISTRNTSAESWTAYGSMTGPSNTPGHSSSWLTYSGSNRLGRYVKFNVLSSGQHTFISEVEILGDIVNSWKNVPDYGCIQGAYPAINYSLQIGSFESLIGKKISMVLWYGNMGDLAADSFVSYLSYLWWNGSYAGVLMQNLNYTGARYLQLGWEPHAQVTAAQIAQGCYDSYFKQWFTDSINYSNRHNNADPVWLRPMSEMNGSWTFAGNTAAWGGDPDNYRRAWRRMYNIAEQVGGADKNIFIFSPNGVSYPGYSWNQPIKYYPGDQYVDWIGVSVYHNPSAPTPSDILQPFADQWPYKPIIISEGSCYTTDTTSDGVAWVNDWFDIQYNFPTVKAFVWFNSDEFALQNLPEEVFATYKLRLNNSYFLSQSIAGRLDFNKDYFVNFADFSPLARNWSTTTFNRQGDINGDNNVNFKDLAIMAGLWLQ